MKNEFIVLDSFQYMIECTCPRPEHTFFINLHKGDIITVTEEKKYVDSLGWLVLVLINETSVFMFTQELEAFVQEKKICNVIDLELQVNYLQYKVNETLDSLDKTNFEQYAKELAHLRSVKDSLTIA